jgi:uncharacterized protein (TIGR00106 family)
VRFYSAPRIWILHSKSAIIVAKTKEWILSVLMEMAMFPTEGSGSKSAYVARIVKMVQKSGFNYTLTPMGTIVETLTMEEALKLIEQSYALLESDCERVYATVKFDIRKGREDAMGQKVASVEAKLKND